MLQGGFGTGGAEKIMAAIAAHRHAQGDEVQVAGMFMPPAGPFFPYPRGVRLNVLAGDAPRDRLLQLRRLAAIRALIRRVMPDVILSFLTKVNCLTLLAARGTGVPVVISERNNPVLRNRLSQSAHIAAARLEPGRIMAQWDTVLSRAVQPRRAAMAWSS